MNTWSAKLSISQRDHRGVLAVKFSTKKLDRAVFRPTRIVDDEHGYSLGEARAFADYLNERRQWWPKFIGGARHGQDMDAVAGPNS